MSEITRVIIGENVVSKKSNIFCTLKLLILEFVPLLVGEDRS